MSQFSIGRAALALGLVVGLHAPGRADIVVTALDGRFVNPVGGENQGVGTNSFSTGLPFGDAGAANFIEFFPVPSVRAPGDTLSVPSDSVRIGTFRFQNGVTQLGTSASSVQLSVTGTATFVGVEPELVRPVTATRTITFSITPNNTGDPVIDGDIWTPDNGTTLQIPEGVLGTVGVNARFIPREINSPPKYFDIEFTDFTPIDGGIVVTPAVPAPPGVVLGGLGVLALGWHRVARRRRATDSTPLA